MTVAERQRRERDRAQQVLDTAQVMLVALDTEGRIQLANRFACDVLGWTADELLGRNWCSTCLPERLRDAWKEKFRRLLAGDLPKAENAVLTKSGSERMIEWRNTVQHDDAGRVTGTLSSGADVTDRHALEAQFQHSQKMEAVGQLAGGIAHDFNNLLTVILGFSNLLLSESPADDPRRPDIAEIRHAGLRAAALTRQLLSFSRKQVVELELLDVNVLIEEMRELLSRLIGADVQIVVTHDVTPEWVRADQSQLEQVVMNLAVNARDAMLNGGTLTIGVTHVSIGAVLCARGGQLERGQYAKLTFTDTGTGMTPPVMARLFEPFFTTKCDGKGTGLGLATVHGIVGRFGGCIDVETVLGRGTAFTIYLPQALPQRNTTTARPPFVKRRACNELILVVDDDRTVGDLTARMLKRMGYRVLVASNAAEGREAFKANPLIDLILTDVVMPLGSGPEFAGSIVDQCPAMKVVYMSGYADAAIAHHGVLAPGIVFLRKPFSAELLALKVSERLDKSA